MKVEKKCSCKVKQKIVLERSICTGSCTQNVINYIEENTDVISQEVQIEIF
jgi:hypothetical protein